MSPDRTLHRRWRRMALATVGASLIASMSMLGANPAAAANAPLVTTDGVGIRVDENAILGPALELIETEMQVFADDLIQQGAEDNSVMDNPDWVWTDSNLELGFDFVNAGTTGYPQGGLKVDAQIQDIRMQFYRYGEWWQPECLIEVNPTTSFINASAKINTALLPNAPLQLNPITATWDEDPAVTLVDSPWTCNGYLIDEWWEGLWGNGSDIATGIENDLNAQAQDLVNDLWAENVTPVINSLSEFGITFNQIRTDDNGLIVTANVNATNGIPIPGDPSGLPRDVTNAQDSGVTSNVNTLLANRASDAIVTIHPNVANQFLYALTRSLNGQFGGPTVSDSIEDVLLDPAVHGAYDDAGWTVSLSMATPTGAPYLQPTGAGGAPQARFDSVNVIVRNTSKGTSPVGVFRGSLTGVDLETVVRPGTSNFGPSYDPTNAAISLTRISGNTDIVAFNGNPAGLLPYVKNGVTYFDEAIFQSYVSLAPITLGGLSVNLCTTCGRYSGDQRYTETFTVG